MPWPLPFPGLLVMRPFWFPLGVFSGRFNVSSWLRAAAFRFRGVSAVARRFYWVEGHSLVVSVGGWSRVACSVLVFAFLGLLGFLCQGCAFSFFSCRARVRPFPLLLLLFSRPSCSLLVRVFGLALWLFYFASSSVLSCCLLRL